VTKGDRHHSRASPTSVSIHSYLADFMRFINLQRCCGNRRDLW
jgi:hypothetical protein